MDKILAFSPYTRPFYGQYIDALISSKHPKGAYVDWKRLPDHELVDARNIAREMVLVNDFTHLLFIDNDATWGRDAIDRLYNHDKDIVCATMMTRAIPPRPTVGFLQRKSGNRHIYRFDKTFQLIREVIEREKLWDDLTKVMNDFCLPFHDGDLIPIDGCGMHFTMIKREVLETIEPPAFEMLSSTEAGEDFYFCRKAKEAGFEIFWDRTLYTGHSVGEDNDVGLRELIGFFRYTDTYELYDPELAWEVELPETNGASKVKIGKDGSVKA